MKIKLVLESGTEYEGISMGYFKDTVCEVVFNTAVTGYTELMTDPSYSGQGVVMASPIIGNYGIFESSFESNAPSLASLIIRNKTIIQNDARDAKDLSLFLNENKIVGMAGVDTRKLTLEIREKGTMKGVITTADISVSQALEMISSHKFEWQIPKVSASEIKKYSKNDYNKRIALIDYGVKKNIVRILVDLGCEVTVFPHTVKAHEIEKYEFDGIVLSNGPGDPKSCVFQIEEIKKLVKDDIPILGICLGHQLIARSFGFETIKLKYGHRGINHTVKNLETGRCYITSQNHSYCVDESTIDENIAKIGYLNINDGSVEGLIYKNKNIVSVQFHPEGAPGPMDTKFIFNDFLKIIDEFKCKHVL